MCKLPVAGMGPQTLGLLCGLVVPKKMPEDLFLVEVGKLVPSPPSLRRLDHGHVLLDSKALYVGVLASGPTS